MGRPSRPVMRRIKFTPPEVAEMWGVSVEKVLTWIRNGELRAVNAATKKDGERPRYLIDLEDINDFERSRATRATGSQAQPQAGGDKGAKPKKRAWKKPPGWVEYY